MWCGCPHLNELIFKQKLKKESVSEEGEGHACLLTWGHESLMPSGKEENKGAVSATDSLREATSSPVRKHD